MSQYLQDFITFFGIDRFFNNNPITVQETIGLSLVAFIGCIFTILGARCVFELIKIVTDWSNFK